MIDGFKFVMEWADFGLGMLLAAALLASTVAICISLVIRAWDSTRVRRAIIRWSIQDRRNREAK
tara:strand:+ start:102 stop:293 length:192 start_codon:yes stop_codon:yes gene_type:complete